MLNRKHHIGDFLRRGIWEVDENQLSRRQQFFLRQLQFAILTLREFAADDCLLRASALTYVTLLSLVPLFALTFAVLTGLGVQNTLEPILLEKLTVGSEEIVDQIITYINNTNVGSLGVAGIIGLVLTVVTLFSNIETTLNHLWGVKETRPLLRRFADYTSVLLIGPIFLFAAISMTSTLENQAFVQSLMERAFVGQLVIFLFRVIPYLAVWAAFVFLFISMPNVKVRLRAALVGGILGGTLWQLAQWVYVVSQVGVARYNAIYGTLAALPILMIWIYLSWAIVLLGAEVAYVWQNQAIIRREIREKKINFLNQEMVALAIMAVVAAVFEKGEKPWNLQQIASCLGLPPRLSRMVTAELVHLGFLSEVVDTEEDSRYLPRRPPDKVRVYDIVAAFRSSGAALRRPEGVAEWKAVRQIERRLVDAENRALSGMTLEALATGKVLQGDDV